MISKRSEHLQGQINKKKKKKKIIIPRKREKKQRADERENGTCKNSGKHIRSSHEFSVNQMLFPNGDMAGI